MATLTLNPTAPAASPSAPGTLPAAPPPAAPTAPDPELVRMLAAAGLKIAPDGTITVDDTAAVQPSTTPTVPGDVPPSVPDPTVPSVTLSPAQAAAAASFAQNLSAALNEAFASMGELKGDDMLTAFLKISVGDAATCMDVDNKLSALLTDQRKQQIEGQQKLALDAAAKMDEAIAKAENATMWGKIISAVLTVVTVIVSVIIAAVTFGVGAACVVGGLALVGALVGALMDPNDPLEGAMLGAQIGAAVGSLLCGGLNLLGQLPEKLVETGVQTAVNVLKGVLVGAQLAGQGTKGLLDLDAKNAQYDAEETETMAKMRQLLADNSQALLKDVNAMIKAILEAKDKTVESVISIMNSNLSTKMQLLAAGAAR
jgi:hypothetical protein